MIETNRCRIDLLKNSDYEKVKELYTNEKARKFLGGIVSTKNFNMSFHNMLTCDENSYYWVVRLKCNNEVIGLVSLDKHHDGFSTEVSYQFMPEYWGYGYAEEVIRKIIEYAFNSLIIKKIVAETQSANKASCKLLLKIGMSLEQIVSRFGAEQYIFSISKDSV
ncbi:MAG: GNAT family N-acetyltransferase [Clostridium sp.]